MNFSKNQTLFQLVPWMYFLCSILLSCSVTLKERKRPLYNPYYSNTKEGSARLPQIRLRAVSLFSWSVEQNARDTQKKHSLRFLGPQLWSKLSKEERNIGTLATFRTMIRKKDVTSFLEGCGSECRLCLD